MSDVKFYKIFYRINFYNPRDNCSILRVGFKIVSVKNNEEINNDMAIRLISEKPFDILIRKIIEIKQKDIKKNLHVVKEYRNGKIYSWVASQE